MATIIFSHGFGVRADARGMFTAITEAFPKYNSVTFDYNKVFENGDIEVAPLNNQAQKLREIINKQSDSVTIIAHSQGCITAGLVDLEKVSKVILLAPPVAMSIQRVVDKLIKKPKSEINLSGVSKLPRSDGTTTLISKDYIDSVSSINPLDVYKRIGDSVDTVVVRCTDDEVLGLTNVDTVPNVRHRDIKSDHDFSGEARYELLAFLADELK